MTENPYLSDWTTQFGLPPFDQLSDEHFADAFEEAFVQSRKAVNAVAEQDAAPSFANTIEALESADELLDRVGGVFFNLAGANSTDAIQALQRELSPRFAAHHSETMMNETLFARINTLNETCETLGLTPEQDRVLERYYKMFVRSGANLSGSDRTRFAEVMERLATLGTAFSQNVLAEERSWSMALAEEELEGLPQFLIDAAAEAARQAGEDGHIITLSRSLVVPFLQFSPRRELREKAYEAWTARGANGGAHDNREIIAETLKLRHERATLLGYENFSAFKLENEMAKTPEAVRDMLMTVWKPARTSALNDAEKLTELLHGDGINEALQPWDWRYYSEARRKSEFDLDEAELKPYLQLDQIIAASFDCATKLFGLAFKPLDVPLYHPDARAWEVTRDGAHIAVFIGDYFARPEKRSGAWCSRFRAQSRLGGEEVRPHTVNVCNFAKAPEGKPTLLTFDDARTVFHEFGHALHSMLSDVTYPSISGTSVARDFVELPSQLYEHWLGEEEVLSRFAVHAETGAAMPSDLLKRLMAAENYDQGFSTVEYTASALVDLEFHSGAPVEDPMAEQAAILERLGMPEAIRMRHASPHFQHVFSGDGYSSGYYSYMWSEVMDADAFAAFTEAGDIFDAETAESLARNIYAAGGSRKESELYTAFRGGLPKVDALLRQRGLDQVA